MEQINGSRYQPQKLHHYCTEFPEHHRASLVNLEDMENACIKNNNSVKYIITTRWSITRAVKSVNFWLPTMCDSYHINSTWCFPETHLLTFWKYGNISCKGKFTLQTLKFKIIILIKRSGVIFYCQKENTF